MEKILRRILLYLSSASWARYFAVRFPLTRRVSKRFVAGETLAEAMETVDRMRAQGFLVSLEVSQLVSFPAKPCGK